MVDALPASDPRKNFGLFVEPIGRNDERDRFAYRLLGTVSEEALGAVVPSLDDAVEILADDGIVRGFDDRGEVLSGAFRAARLGYVAQISGDDHRAVFEARGGDGNLGFEFTAVGAQDRHFYPVPRIRGLSRCKEFLEIRPMRAPQPPGHHGLHGRSAEDVFLAIAE